MQMQLYAYSRGEEKVNQLDKLKKIKLYICKNKVFGMFCCRFECFLRIICMLLIRKKLPIQDMFMQTMFVLYGDRICDLLRNRRVFGPLRQINCQLNKTIHKSAAQMVPILTICFRRT
jgi:hypothetical protein